MHAIYSPDPHRAAIAHRDDCLLAGMETVLVLRPGEATVYTFQDNEHGATTYSRTGSLGRHAKRVRDAGRVGEQGV